MNVHAKLPAPIKGAKGGGKGKGGGRARTPQVDPNSLFSDTTVRSVHLICAGPIGGLVDGAKSIIIDRTPLQNADNSFNYENVSWTERKGLPDQPHMTGFDGVDATYRYNQEIVYSAPKTHQITDPDVDEVIVTIRVPSLVDVNDSNGDRRATSVQFTVELMSSGGTFRVLASPVIRGKTTSAFDRSYAFDLPATGAPWSIRVSRVTPVSDRDTLANDIFLDRIAEVKNVKLTYPSTALVGMEFNTQTLTGEPRARFDADLMFGPVPANYDAQTRTYTGIWDGRFIQAQHSNPAWVAYFICTDPHNGMGLDASRVNAADLYTIARHCDEMINDGAGGRRPRFTFNGLIDRQRKPYAVLQDIASIWHGMVYEQGGQLRFTSDVSRDTDLLVTPANVIDGSFAYSTTPLGSRKSVVNVTWHDPANDYRKTTEVVEDADMIAQVGVQRLEIARVGCTNRSEAVAHGRWYLAHDKLTNETITYRAALDHFVMGGQAVAPGHVIAVADPHYQGTHQASGRILANTGTRLTLDRDITIARGHTYKLMIMTPDGAPVSRDLNMQPGDYTTVDLAIKTADNAVWMLTSTNLQPRLWRVVNVREIEDDGAGPLVEVSAVKYTPDLLKNLERDYTLPAPPVSLLPSGPLPPPTNLQFIEYLNHRAGAAADIAGELSCTLPDDPRIETVRYEVFGLDRVWRLLDGGITASTSLTIRDALIPGEEYRFRARTQSVTGFVSRWAITAKITVHGAVKPPPPANVSAQGGIGQITVRWDTPAHPDFKHVEVWIAKASTDRSDATMAGTTSADTFVATDLDGLTTYTIWLRAVVHTAGVDNKSDFTASVQAQTRLMTKSELDQAIQDALEAAEGSKDADAAIRYIMQGTGTGGFADELRIINSRIEEISENISVGEAATQSRLVKVADNFEAGDLRSKAFIEETAKASATALAAEVTARERQVAQLKTDVATNTAAITTESKTRAAADVAETKAREQQIAQLKTDVATNTAAITTERNTRVTADQAEAQTRDRIIARLRGRLASVEQTMSSRTGLDTGLRSRWMLKVQAGSASAGIVVTALEKPDGTATSDFAILADKFRVVQTVSGAPKNVFSVYQIRGQPTVGISGDMFIDGTIHGKAIRANTIDADRINATTLSAISANIGTVTTGILRSTDGNMVINLAQGRITWYQEVP